MPAQETITSGQALTEMLRLSGTGPMCIVVDTHLRRVIGTSDSTTRAAMLSALSTGVPCELAPDSGDRAPTWTRISKHQDFPEGLEDPAITAIKPARSVGALVNFLLTRVKEAGYFGFAVVDKTAGRVWIHAIDGDPAPFAAALTAIPVNSGTMGVVLHEPTRMPFE